MHQMVIKMKYKSNRRQFIKSSSLAALGLSIVPSKVISGLGYTAPSDLLNVAAVGVGGMGRGKLKNMAKAINVVGLADVDWKYAMPTFEEYPNAKRYKDYRTMFSEIGKDIDAVLVATPDHTHAIVAADAMTMGKHVYVEKPLTHSVSESRLLTQMADKYQVATQMGNQGSSSEDIRKICEWIWNGEIGEVKEVHCWTNRPIWPQGLERPAMAMEVPDTLDWDLFLGPAASRPYHEIYTPWNWRGWWDFGTGALGDMACHIMDNAYLALKLKYPTKVQATSTTLNTESPPQAETVQFTFPARAKDPKIKIKFPEVKLSWYDGGIKPPRPAKMPAEFVMGDSGGGTMFIGSKDILVAGVYSSKPQLVSGRVPNSPKTLPRVKEGLNHETDWVRACKENAATRIQTSSNFAVSGPFNEIVVMGVLATRLQGLNKELIWDGPNMQFSNIKDTEEFNVITTNQFAMVDGKPKWNTKRIKLNAQQAAKEYISRTYREGWKLPSL